MNGELTYIRGDLLKLGEEVVFDVVAHGNNCFCNQDRGIARQFSTRFRTADASLYRLEGDRFRGDINKLGQIEARRHEVGNEEDPHVLYVSNMYTQYRYGSKEVYADYDAIRLCLRKLNHMFKGKRIGLPKIGCGLAKGDWMIVERIIKQELKDCTVTVVEYQERTEKNEHSSD